MDTSKRREQLARLSERIVESVNPREATREILQDIVPAVADCALLYWVDATGQLTLEEARSVEQTQEASSCVGTSCRELAKSALARGEVATKEPVSEHVRHATVIPLVAHGQVLGALPLCQCSGTRDIGLVREFAEQVACCARCAFEMAQYRTVARGSRDFVGEYLDRAIYDLASPLGTLSLVLETGLERVQKGLAPNEVALHRAVKQVERMTVLLKELLEARREVLAKLDAAPTSTTPVCPTPPECDSEV